MTARKHLASLQTVGCAAVRALGFAGLGHIQIDLGVAVPQLHIGLGARAEHATLGIEVFGGQFDDGVRGHFSCLSLDFDEAGLLPETAAKPLRGVIFTPRSASGRTWGCGR